MTEMSGQLWTYRSKLIRVVDGDTIDLEIDQGFRSYRMERIRLLHVNAPEVHGLTKVAGDAATAFTRDWLRVGVALDPWPLTVQTSKSDDFGRFLGIVWRQGDPISLNQALLTSAHAVAYDP